MHDLALRQIIDCWLVAVGEEDFTNLLPVLRRGFSTFDRSERRRLLDEIAKDRRAGEVGRTASPDVTSVNDAPGFVEALPLLLTILGSPPEVA